MTEFIFPSGIKKNTLLIPSVCKISFAPFDDVDTISSAPDRFHRHIDFKSEKAWQEIYFTPGTAEFNEKAKDTDAGELIEQSLKFIFPGEDETNLSDLDAITGRPVLVKIEFATGSAKLLGEFGNGAKLSRVSQVSTKSTGSQLEFSCLATYRACWITQ